MAVNAQTCIQQNFARRLTGHSDDYSNVVGICIYVKKFICSSFIAFKKKKSTLKYRILLNYLLMMVIVSPLKRKKIAVRCTVLLLQHSKLQSAKILKFGLPSVFISVFQQHSLLEHFFS